MKVLSYNIWFSEQHRISRLESLITSIIAINADVVCLQEVLHPVYNILIRILRHIYPYFTDMPKYSYGLMIMSKIKMNEATSHYFENSLMSRYVLMAELDKPNIIIATAHFESEFKDCKKKHSQYSECKKLLEKKHEKKKLPVVLTCDSNCGFKDEIYFFKGWKDCWKDKGNKDNKFTYDGKTNPNINHNYRNRLDRIIYKGKNMSVKSFDMHKNVKGMHIPSDHYGVIADLFC